MERSRTKVAVCLLAVLLAGHFLPCQAVEAQKRSKRLWWASVALVVAASALDVASSRGGVETNPLMRGRNGKFNTGRAVMWKSIAMGGMLATEALVVRRSPTSARSAAMANIVTAGTVSGLAIRNLKIQASEPASR
jgi:nitric oxide reductase large subunit